MSGGPRAAPSAAYASIAAMPIPNVFTQQFEYDDADPAGYRAGVTLIGKAAGGRDNIVKEFEVPPGESVCPYHYEYEEVWLLLLEGAVILRTPQGERTIERGDLVCFPPG